jgi:cellulose biosynthesis protein BcsQ
MQTIAFYNLKGGVGKTATAVNMAWHAARWKHRTVLWDLDPQGAASFYLGADVGAGYQAGSLLKGKQGLAGLKRETRWPNLDVIPADLSLRNADIKLVEAGGAKQRLKELIAPFGEQYSLAVLDCPPTLSPVAESIFAAADWLIVPVIPTHLSLRAFEQVQDWLEGKRFGKLRVIPFFNMVDRRRDLHVEMLVKRPAIMKEGLNTWIPYSTHVEQMGDHHAPVGEFAPYTPAAQAYRAMWFELLERLAL